MASVTELPPNCFAVLINLDWQSERRERFYAQEHLELHPSDVESVSGVDGRAIDPPPWYKPVKTVKQRRGAPGDTARGNYGFNLAYAYAMSKYINRNLLIVEDDCLFAPDWVEAVVSAARELPVGWMNLSLGGRHREPLTPVSDDIGICNHTVRTEAVLWSPRRREIIKDVICPDTDTSFDNTLARMHHSRDDMFALRKRRATQYADWSARANHSIKGNGQDRRLRAEKWW